MVFKLHSKKSMRSLQLETLTFNYIAFPLFSTEKRVSLLCVLYYLSLYFFTPLLKETFISEATWLKVTWRRSVAYTGQHSSCACQLGRAPRFCSLALPCYPPSFVFQLKFRTLEDIMPLYILTDGRYFSTLRTFSNLTHESDELNVANDSTIWIKL